MSFRIVKVSMQLLKYTFLSCRHSSLRHVLEHDRSKFSDITQHSPYLIHHMRGAMVSNIYKQYTQDVSDNMRVIVVRAYSSFGSLLRFFNKGL